MCCGDAAMQHPQPKEQSLFYRLRAIWPKGYQRANAKILFHFSRSLKKKHKKSNTEYAIYSKNMVTLLAVLLFS